MTAVEWLIHILKGQKDQSFNFEEWMIAMEHGKEIEKEQMVRAFHAGCKEDYAIEEVREWAEDYISNTYNKSKTPPGEHCEEA